MRSAARKYLPDEVEPLLPREIVRNGATKACENASRFITLGVGGIAVFSSAGS